MQVSTPSKELAEIEFKRIVSVTWPSLAVLYSAQVIASQSSIHWWQLYYVAGIAISALISGVIWFFSKSAYSFTPIVIYMLVAPLLLGSIADTPWMSYGLLTVGANLYFSSITPWQVSLFVMVSVTAFQSWVISHNLSSITDTNDMRLLGTYFSTLWTLGIGIMMLIIRSRYLRAVEKVDDRIDLLKNQISNRLHGISKRNREDFRNLKLHGTVLNTLIFARANLKSDQDREVLLKTLRSEISNLEDNSGKLTANFQQVLLDEIAKRSSGRASIEVLELQASISDEKLQNIYLEIIRELLLNIEKHTVATEITLSVRERASGEIFISITENSPEISEIQDLHGYIRQSSASQSLRRLLNSAPADLTVSYDSMTQKIIFEVSPRDSSGATATSTEISKLRNESLLEFSINFARAISIVGLFFLPGYYLVGERGSDLVVLTLQVIFLIANVFYGLASKKLLGLSILLSLITPLYLSQSVESCSQVQYFPWLINIVMVSAFSFALLYKNQFLRWVPLGILTLEMILLPLGFPVGCRTIFVGSLPGIPLIVAFAMVIAAIRKRAVEHDSMQIRTAFEDEKNINEVEEKLNSEYNQLLQSLKLFTAKFERAKEREVSDLIDSIIQQIRAFLICSEQFESKIVREFYFFSKSRLASGFSTRISMLGDNFFELDHDLELTQFFNRLDRCLGKVASGIALIRVGLLTLEIEVENPGEMQTKTSELSADYPEVKLLIKPIT